MDNFMDQIREDIALIQERQSHIKNIEKDEYAFNYWVLTKLYGMDESLCEENITEYSDKGLDCWIADEESKVLTIIQNKYYSATNPVSSKEVSDFLTRPTSWLNKGTYTRSEALQAAWTKAKAEGYVINLDFYVTNDMATPDIISITENQKSEEFYFHMNFLKDIKSRLFEEDSDTATSMKATLKVASCMQDKEEGAPESYYALVKLNDLYSIVKQADAAGYNLYEKNVRDYLGNTKGINKGIAETLKSENRKNFHLYSNGITMICGAASHEGDAISIDRPQIVNGCQSTNTISEVIKNEAEKDKFGSSKVLVKILVLDSKLQNELFKDIVKYTNSQNSINEKVFGATKKPFFMLKERLQEIGLLMKVKQSDQYDINKNYKGANKRRELSEILAKTEDCKPIYDFSGKTPVKNLNNITIDVSTVLQITGAFMKDAQFAYLKKADLMKPCSAEYKFSTSILDIITTGGMKKLIALYRKVEQYKKEKGKAYSTYYLLNFIGRECERSGIDKSEFMKRTCISDLKELFESFKDLPDEYYVVKKTEYNTEYNKMIKQKVDLVIMDRVLDAHFEGMRKHNPEKHEKLKSIFGIEMLQIAEEI
jgi:hypothetical protein